MLWHTIDLHNNNLQGNIPDFSNWHNCTSIDLSNNQLTGTISNGINNVILLQTLSLNNNQLSGTIPTNIGNSN